MNAPKRHIQISAPSTGEEEWIALREPLESGWLTQGPKVAEFESAFALRHCVKHAVAVSSATTGLHLALACLGIGPGDEVIVPSLTWVATANAVIYCGATPVLADVDTRTFNVIPDQIARHVTSRTRAVVPVHLFGRCADVDVIRALLPAGIAIVEDAACAAGADDKGRPAGSIGDVGIFSFHPRKSITTGEGGMLTTNRDDIAELALSLRNHGASESGEQRQHGPRPYLLSDFNRLGFNYRMTELQGAVGIVQLNKLDRFIDERSRWAGWYRSELTGLHWLRMPEEPNGGRHAWQSFVTYVEPTTAPKPRNAIMDLLQARGIATRPGTHAVHMLGYYRERFGLRPDDYPGARDCDRNSLALPMHNRMTGEDYQYVVDCLHQV